MLTDDVMSNYLTAGVQVLSPEFWEGLSGKMPDDIIGMNLAELAFSSDSEYQEFVDRYNQWLNRGRGLDPDWIGEVEVTAEQAINWALAENDLTISAKELYKNWLDVSDYGASAYKYLLGTADN